MQTPTRQAARLPEEWNPADDRRWEQKTEHFRLYGKLTRNLKEMAKAWTVGWLREEEAFQEIAATVWMLAAYYHWSVTLHLEDEERGTETVKLIRKENGRFAFERVQFPRL